jgi:hypothetical protein
MHMPSRFLLMANDDALVSHQSEVPFQGADRFDPTRVI